MHKRENLIIHIEGLQATLTKRNKRIAELEAMLAGEGQDERQQRALDRARKEGWQACSEHLMSVTAEAARQLGKVRRDAWDLYLEKEREATARARGELDAGSE
jgi:hypothetical protein